MSTAALLLPLTAATDSRVQSGAPGTAVSSAAHVNFKIVIPTILFLNVGGGADRTAGAQTVAVVSNGRSATLNATTSDSSVHARNVILSAAARKSIAQDAECRLGEGQTSASTGPRRMVCTISTP